MKIPNIPQKRPENRKKTGPAVVSSNQKENNRTRMSKRQHKKLRRLQTMNNYSRERNVERSNQIIMENRLEMFCLSVEGVKDHFKNKGLEVFKEEEKYLILKGELPIALVAHMDTVPMYDGRSGKFPPIMEFDGEILSAPWTGLGADDRAGCLAIDLLLNSGFKPWVILTDEEECGCHGAKELVKDIPQAPFLFKCMIQLDRRGPNDCVFYDMDTDCETGKEFVKKIESYGFKETMGSFSDISELAPAWKIAATNLSIGYEHEHTSSEILNMSWFYKTIERVKNILSEINSEDWKTFGYTENWSKWSDWGIYGHYSGGNNWKFRPTGPSVRDESESVIQYANLLYSQDFCPFCMGANDDTELVQIVHDPDCQSPSLTGIYCECPACCKSCLAELIQESRKKWLDNFRRSQSAIIQKEKDRERLERLGWDYDDHTGAYNLNPAKNDDTSDGEQVTSYVWDKDKKDLVPVKKSSKIIRLSEWNEMMNKLPADHKPSECGYEDHNTICIGKIRNGGDGPKTDTFHGQTNVGLRIIKERILKEKTNTSRPSCCLGRSYTEEGFWIDENKWSHNHPPVYDECGELPNWQYYQINEDPKCCRDIGRDSTVSAFFIAPDGSFHTHPSTDGDDSGWQFVDLDSREEVPEDLRLSIEELRRKEMEEDDDKVPF